MALGELVDAELVRGLKVLWQQEVPPGIANRENATPAGLVSLPLQCEGKLRGDMSSQPPQA